MSVANDKKVFAASGNRGPPSLMVFKSVTKNCTKSTVAEGWVTCCAPASVMASLGLVVGSLFWRVSFPGENAVISTVSEKLKVRVPVFRLTENEDRVGDVVSSTKALANCAWPSVMATTALPAASVAAVLATSK